MVKEERVGHHIILIMASGGGTTGTWHSAEFPNKHILPIGGEPLVARAARQVEELSGVRPIVLTPWLEVQETVPLYFVPAWYGAYTDTILSAAMIWAHADRTTVLNGDVVWHPDVLEFILSGEGSPRIYGSPTGQLYAWAFELQDVDKVIRAAHGKTSHNQIGFFRQLCGYSQLRESEWFCPIPTGTYTRDFDIAKDYDRWCANIPEDL